MNRAIAFYQKVFDCSIEMIDMVISKWPFSVEKMEQKEQGNLVSHKGFNSTNNLPWKANLFNSFDVSIHLAKVEEAGGTVRILKKNDFS